VVTVSHAEPNHAAFDVVGGSPRLVDRPGEYEIGGAMIQGVATPGHQRTRNTAFLITLDEIVVCHLGDLGQVLTAEQVATLKDPDVLLIPVGGHCTIAASQAAEVVSQLEPRVVVPMHYRTPAADLPLDPLDRFCSELAANEVTPQPKLSVTRGSLPDETGQLVVLDYRR
jgi:L-ascorbate metabolism protein UlaG (beta-lactamase superfamily)